MKQKHWKVSVFNKTSETVRDDAVYTTDTEAYLVFELTDEDFTPDSAMVTVYNIYGKATINANVEVADGFVRYEMPEEAIGHPGGWRTQVVYTKDDEDYTTKIIEFDIGGHLLDNKKPSIVDIENWNSFIEHAEELIDDWEQLEEIRQANEQQRELAESVRQTTFETNESTRQSEFETNETSRQTNELVREEAENNRQSTFETNEAERESTFETNESTRQASEQARESAESVRVANEEERELNEAERISKDSERDSKIEAVEGFVENFSETQKDINKQIMLTTPYDENIFYDTFNRSNRNIDGDISDSGHVWESVIGEWLINDNKLINTDQRYDSTNIVVLDKGANNATIEATVFFGNGFNGFALWVIDESNYIYVKLRDRGRLSIISVKNNIETSLVNDELHHRGAVFARIKCFATFNLNQLRIFCEFEGFGSYSYSVNRETSDYFRNATKFGIYNASNNGTVENFTMK